MPDAAGCLRQLIGSHTAGGHWDDGAPMSVAQVLGEATVGELADAVHADQIAPLQAERDELRREKAFLVDERDALRERLNTCSGSHRFAMATWQQAEAERDRMRAALVEIRDRHQRHGDRCRDCGQHPRYRHHRDDCHLCEVPHPCPDRQTAERGLKREGDRA